MTDLHPFPESATTGTTSETRRFRAETYEAAVAVATTELGAGVRVVEANRIRRGGLGGFFATDLGVEVTVVVDPSVGEPVTDPTTPMPAPERGAAIDITERTDSSGRVAASGLVPDPRGRPIGDALTPHSVASPDSTRRTDTRRDDTFVDEVLALTEGGMESLLREIQIAERNDSFAAQLEHWDDELDVDDLTDGGRDDGGSEDGGFIAQMGGPVDEQQTDTTFAEQMLASARADLARQVERLQQSGRRRADDAATATRPIDADTVADIAAATARQAAADQVDAARMAAEHAAAEAERRAVARATAEQAMAERAEFDRLAAERAAAEAQRAAAAAEREAAEREAAEREAAEAARVAAERAEVERAAARRAEAERAAARTVRADDAALIALDEMLRQVGVDMTGGPRSSAASQPITGQPITGQPITGQPTNEQPTAGESPAEALPVPAPPMAPVVDDDPLRRPTELAAAATDRLVSRLAAVVAADGSCLQDLHRVRVAVTTHDGMVIEMTAEMGGAS